MAEEHIRHWLSAYLDHELSSTQRTQVDAHLAGCDACMGELQSLRSLSSLLQESELPAVELSQEQFVSSVLAELPASKAPSSWRQMLWAVWWAAPLFVLLGWVFVHLIAWAVNLYLLADLAGWLSQGNLALLPAGAEVQEVLAYGVRGLVAWVQAFTPLGLGARWLSSEFLGWWSSAALVVLLACWLASWWMLQKRDWIRVRASSAHK
jgi:anti-sigma factor RsiW